MPFGNLTTFYIPQAAASASLWGTNVRKLAGAEPAAGTALTTVLDFGTSTTAVVRTVSPYATTADDLDQAAYGWAIDPADMGSANGARRFFKPGTHAVTVQLQNNGAVGGDLTLLLYVYRVSSAATSRGRSLLGSGTVAVTLPVNTVGGGRVEATVTVTLPEVVLGVDETVQYALEASAAGIALTGRTVAVVTGVSTTVARVQTPGLGVLADTAGTSTGAGVAAAVTGLVRGADGAAAGGCAVTGLLGATAASTGAAAGVGVAAGAGSAVAGSTGAAAGSCTVAGSFGAVKGTTGTVAIGASTPDYPVTTPGKAVAGVVRNHETDAPIAGATVRLFRVSDDLLVQTTTTTAGGAYSFPRDVADPNTYYVTMHADGAPQVHGISDRGLVPA